AYDKWSGLAIDAFNKAQTLASQIANFPIQPVQFNAHFDPQLALAPFPTLPKPVAPADLTYHPPVLPGAPPTLTVPNVPDLTYVSQLLAGVKNVLGAMLGGEAMPAALAQALRNRAYTEANTEEGRAVGQAYDEFAARGFNEPAGQLNRRITEARSDALAKRQLINRDIYIQDQTVAIDSLRFAVTGGIQLEGMNVQVFQAEADVALKAVDVSIETNKLIMDQYRLKVEVFDTQLRAEIARVDTTLKAFLAQVDVYRADAQIATAAGEYDNRRFQLNLSQEQAIVDTEMKRADQTFEQMKYITSVMLEIKKTLATVGTQLAAAAMSAVNIGASLSSSTSQSVGYSLGISYSGSMEDA
ncbi:MAG: hypothetical protein ABIY56_01710, partial [Dokdonella sp.]